MSAKSFSSSAVGESEFRFKIPPNIPQTNNEQNKTEKKGEEGEGAKERTFCLGGGGKNHLSRASTTTMMMMMMITSV